MAEMAGMSELSEMSEEYIWATRHATMCPVSKNAEMSDMTARHVMHSLGKPAV
jgi:hypothetical protein